MPVIGKMNKIIVQYDPWSRMGNRMFLYAFGIILSILTKKTLIAEALPNFINTKNYNTSDAIPYNPLYLKEEYGNNFVNFEEICNTNRDIIINSYLQKSKYYVNHKELLKHLFYIDPTPYKLPQKDELIIHIRSTDYNSLGMEIKEDFYKNILSNFNNVTIVTDDPTCNVVKKLNCNILSTKTIDKFCHYSDKDSIQDYIYMLFADYLLISHSTFSWWPAFLGEHKKVFYPTVSNSMWKKDPQKDDIDLYIEEFERI